MRWRVGIADSGVAMSSMSDDVAVIASRSFVDEPASIDSHGHGTTCWAAFEGALALHRVPTDAFEIVYAKLFTLRTPRCAASTLAAALLWMIEQRSAIIALPCGTAEPSDVLWRAVQHASASGVVLVAASGVRSTEGLRLFPAAYEGVVRANAGDGVVDSSRAVMFTTAQLLAQGTQERRAGAY